MSHESRALADWLFQYRKRYEITCDQKGETLEELPAEFQYRKRYEITCDSLGAVPVDSATGVSIPQAV